MVELRLSGSRQIAKDHADLPEESHGPRRPLGIRLGKQRGVVVGTGHLFSL